MFDRSLKRIQDRFFVVCCLLQIYVMIVSLLKITFIIIKKECVYKWTRDTIQLYT